MNSNIIVWSKNNCPNCEKAIALLEKYNLDYEVRKIGNGWTVEQLLEQIPTAKSVPQIFVDNDYLGDYTSLVNYVEET